MRDKDIIKNKRKYHLFRHHAWAGLGFLSVALAVRIIFSEFSQILVPIIFVLILYIVIALIFTYKYHSALLYTEKNLNVKISNEIEKEKIRSDLEKEHLKLEKKKAKAEIKKKKKSIK
jgi:cell division protein YceG involved in septum cleavage